MLIDLTETEREELIDFYKRKAVKNLDFNVVARCVHTVEKLTKKEEPQPLNMTGLRINEKETTKRIIEKVTDVPLSYHYNSANKREYKIQRLHSKDGHLICNGRPLKLTINDILKLKKVLDKQTYTLETQKEWISLAESYGVNWMVLQRYAYNIDIGTFDKWIQKYLNKKECQTTLRNTTTCGVKS